MVQSINCACMRAARTSAFASAFAWFLSATLSTYLRYLSATANSLAAASCRNTFIESNVSLSLQCRSQCSTNAGRCVAKNSSTAFSCFARISSIARDESKRRAELEAEDDK